MKLLPSVFAFAVSAFVSTVWAQDIASATDCTAAVDNMFKVEFSKDSAGIENLNVLMAAVKTMPEYEAAVAECGRSFTTPYAKCVAQAKSEEDVKNCNKKLECKSAIANYFAHYVEAPPEEQAAKTKGKKVKSVKKNPEAERQKKLNECVKSMSDEQIKCLQNAQSDVDLKLCTKK